MRAAAAVELGGYTSPAALEAASSVKGQLMEVGRGRCRFRAPGLDAVADPTLAFSS